MLEARPDHIAVAVPDADVALRRWRDELGGRYHGHYDGGQGFRTSQYRFRGGAKLELLEPTEPGPDGFARAFLDRFGADIHHLTLLVPDLDEAVTQLRSSDLDVRDIRRDSANWHEAFLRPSQVGGLVVQIAYSGFTPPAGTTPADGAALRGVRLRHPDLRLAADVWERLGADVDARAEGLEVSWGDAPLRLWVGAGAPAGPAGLIFDGAPRLPRDDDLGAAVLSEVFEDA